MTWGSVSWHGEPLDRNYAVKLLCVCHRSPLFVRLTAAESAQLTPHVFRVLALDWYRWQVAR